VTSFYMSISPLPLLLLIFVKKSVLPSVLYKLQAQGAYTCAWVYEDVYAYQYTFGKSN